MHKNAEIRQNKALEYIQAHYRRFGYGPTVREVAAAAGVKSPSNALAIIRRLEAAGKIERIGRPARIVVRVDPLVDQLLDLSREDADARMSLTAICTHYGLTNVRDLATHPEGRIMAEEFISSWGDPGISERAFSKDPTDVR